MISSQPARNHSSVRWLVTVLVIWFALVFFLGANGAFVQ